MRFYALALLAAILIAVSGDTCRAQNTPGAPAPASSQAGPPAGRPQVLFERSDSAAPPSPSSQKAAEPPGPAITDAMRLAPVFIAYVFEVHLAPVQASLAVEARLTLRNGGRSPLAVVPLQLSSSLHLERASLGGAPLPVMQRQLASDADHTGQLEESAVTLPQPLAPGASVTLSVAYSGIIEAGSARLDRLQTPAELAASSDWDGITDEFTGLRGFGDTVWYPVCSVPALLGDGARLFAEIGRQRRQNQDATIAIHATDEFSGPAPNIAVLAGHTIEPGAPETMPNASFPGVLRLDLAPTRLGFRVPSLFVAVRTASSVAAPVAAGDARSVPPERLRVYSTPEHAADGVAYQAAALLLEPMLTRWLGPRASGMGGQPAGRLAVIDLPVEGAQPSEEGDAVFASLVAAEPGQIAPLLSRELAHVFFDSPRVWLDEGVPALMSNLYVEQTQGPAAALEHLAAARGSLALVEPANPRVGGGGQSLVDASDAIYYRSKALYVLVMLREIVGDKAMAAALTAYKPAADTERAYFEMLLEKASGADLKWFFDAWVYQDLGLPDLSIVNVYSSPAGSAQAQQGRWLVTVDIANDGYAETQVPVTAHSVDHVVTELVRVAGRSRVSHRLLLSGAPTSVEVNDGTVPEVEASVHQRVIN